MKLPTTAEDPQAQQNFEHLGGELGTVRDDIAALQAAPPVISGRINADGTIAAGTGFSTSKIGTGLVSITFTGAGFSLLAIVGSIAEPNLRNVYFTSFTATAVVAQVYNPTNGVSVDAAFSFVAVGA